MYRIRIKQSCDKQGKQERDQFGPTFVDSSQAVHGIIKPLCNLFAEQVDLSIGSLIKGSQSILDLRISNLVDRLLKCRCLACCPLHRVDERQGEVAGLDV